MAGLTSLQWLRHAGDFLLMTVSGEKTFTAILEISMNVLHNSFSHIQMWSYIMQKEHKNLKGSDIVHKLLPRSAKSCIAVTATANT